MGYPFKLPELGYDYSALEPHIDARTMEIHHTKHHQGYTNKLNNALEGHPEFHDHSAEQLLRALAALPIELRLGVRNNGGGYVNHALFWDIMTPGGADRPGGELKKAIDDEFGSLDSLMDRVASAASGQFGSGWGWLTVTPFGTLHVMNTANQDSPLIQGFTPILGVDVWEHAYYLNYQNRRGDYLDAWWNTVNWDRVTARWLG
ncbi:MAG: superoxide dismutase, partial [Gemmatimonadota bacterium]